MTQPKQSHLSYLLRLWQTGSKPTWRASLESLTGERRGFASLEELFAFLKTQTKPNETEEVQENDQTRTLDNSDPSSKKDDFSGVATN